MAIIKCHDQDLCYTVKINKSIMQISEQKFFKNKSSLKMRGGIEIQCGMSEFGYGTREMCEARSFPYTISIPPFIFKLDFLPFFGLYSQANHQGDHKAQE